MKQHPLAFAFGMVILAACYKSEIDQKPAAQVSESAASAEASATAPAITSTEPTPGAVVGRVIKEKSSIDFVAAKVTRDHKGKFRIFDGWIEYAGSKPARIAFDIDLNSVETDTEKLTGHLKTADFFDVAKYPKAMFVSTSLTEAGAGTPPGTTHVLKGNLDLHGVTKEVTIPVIAKTTPDGVRTTSEFTINRHDWGVSYRGAADDLIKDEVLIKLDLMFPPPPA
ncbi:MAG TPA: YceI family protein [Thermoanaerobaculia bacterium]|nr:YceI family protein [Thermoanaerobaculia bacterium]